MRRLSDRVLELSELPSLIRCLTEELPRALGAREATLLLWNRRLQGYEGVALTKDGRLRRFRPGAAAGERAGPRWLLSDGHLLETQDSDGDGVLIPLLGRTGLSGTLVITPPRRRKRAVSEAEAKLVSLVATRAALALENHTYQKELIASERLAALGTVAGMLAHDLRGPITVIRGYAETLLEPGVPAEEVVARGKLIVEAADRLERMTTETLDFAAGAEQLVRRTIPLGLLLAELAAGIEQEFRGLTVVRDFRVASGRDVSLDLDKLRRAVFNIAANATDAMAGSGVFTIEARVERLEGVGVASDHLVLELADEGPGVPAEIRDRLFEPFVTLGKKRGTGLGLAVARRFVEDHGGSLDLLPPSDPPGHGARFRLALPIAAEANDPPR